MKLYVSLLVCSACAAYCFYNSYYGFRYPEDYTRARWTVMRGLPKERGSAFFGAIMGLLVGGLFFLGAFMILRTLLAHASTSLPPL